MGKFKVDIEGQGSFVIEVPDGSPPPTESQVLQALQAQKGQGAAPPSPPPAKQKPPLTYENLRDTFAQGLTFGLADEAAAGLGALGELMHGNTDVVDTYNRRVAQHRADLRQAENDHPVASFAANVVGSLPTMAIPGLNMSRGAKLADTARAALKVGATSGFLSGAGAAEGGVKDRLIGAGKGAVLGGAGAVSVPIIGRTTGRVTQAVADALADTPIGRAMSYLPSVVPVGPQRAAQQVIEALRRDGMTVDNAAAKVAELEGMGKPAMLADAAGEATKRLGRRSLNLTPPGTNDVVETLSNRAENAGGRVIDDLVANTGMKGDAQAVSKVLIEKRATDAAPLYEKAYADGARGVQDPEILKMLRLPHFQQAMNRAKRIASLEGRELPMVVDQEGNFSRIPDLQTLDYIKRGLDDYLFTGRVKGSIGKTEERALKGVRQQFIARLDASFPDYAKARSAFSGPTRMVEAVEDGKRFAQMTPGDITDLLKTEYTTPAEREHFLLGAVDAIKSSVLSTADGADIWKRVFNNQTKRMQLESLFPSKDAFQEFSKRMHAERAMHRTNTAARGNSTSAQQLAGMADEWGPDLLGAIPQVLTGNWSGPMSRALSSRAHGNVGKNAEAALPILFGDPAAGIDLLRRAQEAVQRKAAMPTRSSAPIGIVSGLLTN